MRIISDDVGIIFGLDKCAVLVFKKGIMVRTEAIELPDRKRMGEVNLDGCKYLGMLQLDFIMNREVKEKVKSEYIRRVKKLARSQLIRGNVIAAVNAWAVGINGYGAGVLDWTKEKLKSTDIKTRKLMTVNGSLHPTGHVGRLRAYRF